MASIVKDKKIFNFGGFRGMDTENKPDKVERYRAVAGKNFYIESNSLKTRPALINSKQYNLDGNILGSYIFNGTEIIFTDANKIYFLKGEEIFYTNGSGQNAGEKVFTNLASFSFNSFRPFFVQEKNCLFVFCVGDIYIISYVTNDLGGGAFVVYPVDVKIPLSVDLQKYCTEKNHADLPYAYVPTIQIGDNQYEDVNLLSSKRKYKLFSKPSDGEEEYTTYDLLGDYQSSKNGAFRDIGVDVNFYGQNLKEIKQIPFFEGAENDLVVDFETDTVNYYVFPPTTGAPVLVKQHLTEPIVATEIWEFDEADTGFASPIYEKIGLTKEKALTLKLANGQTIFEYLRDFDLEVYASEFGAKTPIYAVDIDVEYMYRVKNANGVIISAGRKRKATRTLYFSIRTFSQIDVFNFNQSKMGNITTNTSPSFPINYIFEDVETTKMTSVIVNTANPKPPIGDEDTEYKDSDNGNIYHWSNDDGTYNIINDLIYPTILSSNTHEISLSQVADVLAWFKLNNSFSEDILEAQVKVRFTDQILVSPAFSDLSGSLTYPSPSGSLFSAGSLYGSFDYYSYVASSYPYLANPDSKPQITIDFLRKIYDENARYSSTGTLGSSALSLLSSLKSYIKNQNLSAGDYFLIVNLDERVYDNVDKNKFLSGKKCSLGFHITVAVTDAVYNYRHYGYTLQFLKYNEQLNPLYEIKENDGFISLKLSNVLINYKNEPAIDLELTFSKNDYNKGLIANNKFGVSFGSEYRVFLAGNPEFKHIDRYNISNDLLGNNVKNQSYELSYFPSKQYRVVGGSASAINGYVVANDTQLYITKTQAINDSCLFIRTRTMEDSGNISYFEYKTNIMKTPVNERCIVNFYNDIVMLTKDGLLGVEISSNVLTNERLLKLRSGFINQELTTAIKNASSIWCVDDNERLYMFLDNLVYVADARYLNVNENAQISNVSYEIVKWELEQVLKLGFLKDGALVFYDDNRSYVFENDKGKDRVINMFLAGQISFTLSGVSVFTDIFNELQPEDRITFVRKNILDTNKIILGKVFNSAEIILDGGKWTITQDIMDTFTRRTGERMADKGFYIFSGGTFTKFSSLITIGTQVVLSVGDEIFIDIYGKPLYITKTENVGHLKLQMSTRDSEFFTTIAFDGDISDFDFFYNVSTLIELEWFSGVLDFDDKMYEKTMFELTVYARRLKEGNLLKYGYRTLRGYKDNDDDVDIDLSNSISFDEVNFNLFAISTFDNVAITRRQKENNFLYLQFIFRGKGNVEISDIIVYYKNNRKTKMVS